jgi:hypothetical protein
MIWCSHRSASKNAPATIVWPGHSSTAAARLQTNQAPYRFLSLDVAMPIWPLYAFAASTAFAAAAIVSLVLG